MTLNQHTDLANPAGPRHLGDELDCPKCFTALTQPSPVRGIDDPPRPHLMVNGPARTVDLDALGGHTTMASVRPFPTQPGGLWETTCTCGWSKAGPYARDGVGEIVAMRLAETWAAQHRANPLEGTEDE